MSIYKNGVTYAYYEKNGKWIPCVNYENIVEIYERISKAEENEIVVLQD